MVATAGQGGKMVKRGVSIKLKGFSFAWLLRLQHRTWRLCFQNREYLDRLYSSGNPFLLCFWHGKYVPIFPMLEGYHVCVVSSLSVRGSIIAEICKNFGYQSAQIPERSNDGALIAFMEVLSEARAVGTAVDGPLGPRHKVKSGVIRVASAFGFNLLPVSVGSHRKIVSYKRWDRMELPLPFTRVCLVFGKAIKVPPDLRNGQIRQLAGHLAEAMTELDDEAQKLALGKSG
jgi:lysophospholipid acyltransferase (LPLAT)-like uncharacterized protein